MANINPPPLRIPPAIQRDPDHYKFVQQLLVTIRQLARDGTNTAQIGPHRSVYTDDDGELAGLAPVATGNALISGGPTNPPHWGKIGLDTHVDGLLPAEMVEYLPITSDATDSTAKDQLEMAEYQRLPRVRFAGHKPEIIAHRGFRRQCIENTALAFSTALKRGADSLETDVQVSSDGVLYCFHDDTVDALTTGTGTFTSLTSAYIDGLTFDAMTGFPLASLRPTKFSEFLTIARGAGCWIYPEIKAYRTSDDIELIVDAVVQANLQYQCVLQSESIPDLEMVRELNPDIGIGFLGFGPVGFEGYVDTLQTLGNGYLLWEYSELLDNPAIVTYAHDRGVPVVTFTVNNRYDLLRVLSLGVHRVMSDMSTGIHSA